jgi:hypothetical protein
VTAPPSPKYLFAFGQAISRTTYAALLSGITTTQSVSRTNGSPTLTGFFDTTQINIGACVEGAGIPNSGTCTTQILSCTSTTCTMNQNANSSGTANVQLFPYGNGDGLTTFHMPNCAGVVLAGRDNLSGTPVNRLPSVYFGNNADALGAIGGSASRSIVVGNLPNYNLPVTDPGHQHQFSVSSAGSPGVASSVLQSNAVGGGALTTLGLVTTGISVNSGGSGNPLPTVQPTMTANCMIRVLSQLTPSSLAANDNQPECTALIERRRLAA